MDDSKTPREQLPADQELPTDHEVTDDSATATDQREAIDTPEDVVDESSEDSFPASDPPSFTRSID